MAGLSKYLTPRAEADLLGLIEILHGPLPGPGEVTLVVAVRNNPFLMGAFLAHHRSLGVERFLLLDDWSDSSFLSYLRSQPDVTILRVPMRFPERIRRIDSKGRRHTESAGGIYKDLIARHLVASPWSLVLDSDEFLLLAPGLHDLPHLFAEVEPTGLGVFGAQMVDFVPEQWPLGELKNPPEDFSDLVHFYPLFKPAAAWRRVAGQIVWQKDCNAISDIFRLMRIYSGPPTVRAMKTLMRPMMPGMRAFPRSDVSKVPLVGPNHRELLRTHHDVDAPIDGPMVLAIAHFTLTHVFPQKVSAYLQRNPGTARFASQSRYEAYSRLLKRMNTLGVVSFSDLGFSRFNNRNSFLNAGIFEGSLGNNVFG